MEETDTIPPGAAPTAGWDSIRAVLGERNYRVFFIGQGISLIGSWMQQVAVGWLIYRLTHSTFLLGLASFAALLPQMLLTPLAGVLADRWNRQRLLRVLQMVFLLQATLLAFFVYIGWISIGWVIALNFVMGLAATLESPAFHAFVVQLVSDRSRLPHMVAINSIMFNSARLLGSALAGFVVAWLGESVCFLLNALSFVPLLWALMRIRPLPQTMPPVGEGIWHGLRMGFVFTWTRPALRRVLLLFAWVSLLGTSLTVLLPAIAQEMLQRDARGLGLLWGAIGAGALVGALFFATRPRGWPVTPWIVRSAILFGLSLICLSLVRGFWPGLGLVLVLGLGMTGQMTTTSIYLQQHAPDEMRSRVLSFYLLAFFGTMPVGNVVAGASAQAWGLRPTLALAGLACLGGGLWALWRIRKGAAQEVSPE